MDRKRVVKFIVIVFFGFIIGNIFVSAQEPEYELLDIFNSPDLFDGKTIEVEGEALGEVLRPDSGAWINIFSKGNNIGVFSEDSGIFDRINHWGSYKETGDRIRVKGVFNKNCLQHQVSDIHLKVLRIIEPGHENKVMVSPFRVRLAMVFFAICLMMTVIYFINLKYGKRA